MYVGDDEDGNLHGNQSELIAGSVEAENERYNINKVYLDAYPQESTAGGPRYPDANNAINSGVQKGSLVVNYLGHGGHLGWSQERVLTLNDIQGWTNLDRLPVFVTATCSFTGYDEPSYESAGEQVLLNPGGGAVALLTTVRAVYSSSNKRLASAVFDSFFVQQNGEYHALGEIVRLAKNSNPIDTSDINARKFSVIGDPSMIVAYPRHSVALTHINGSATGGIPDTLRALDKVELKGEIRDSDSALLQDFNGRLSLTVFDKPVKTQTLANDPNSFQREFSSLSRIVFKGFATVRDGKFTISFVVPEDISFAYGQGKISMYATDELTTDAAGFYNDFVIGGTSGNIDADNSGPEVELYLNNTSFKSGDIVGPNPLMLVHLEDESGINIIGNSIGHDLEAVLDGDTRNTIVLNDFYEASQDDYTRGEVRYPLYGLEPGRHTLSVTAWDVAGNFSEASIEFYVESDPDNPIRKVWNYPNPFDYSSGTTFRIEHDLVIASADVEIDVFDISGRHVSQFTQAGVPSANGIIEITGWNESAQALGNGIFFYRIGLTANQGSSSTRSYSSAYGKLILVN